MKPKMVWKLTVDIAMTVALLLLMAYELVGQAAHEWIGIGMFVLFILHHILNGSWSRNILKGRYNPVRILQTGIAFLVLCAMMGSMISGVILSRHALAFLPIKGGRSFARNLHMVSAYWGFVLMSVHLGLHWSMIMGMARRLFLKPSAVRKWMGVFGAYASFAVLDPELTASVPDMQVVSGAFDTLSHAMETYLGNSDQDNVSDDLALAVMRNTVVNMRRLIADVHDMQARSNLMWDSAMAENGILKVGRVTDFQAHQMEHQLGAFTDCNHGQGLAVIHPAYYRHILKDAEEKFERFAKVVFDKNTAEEGIQALGDFIKECGLPVKMGELKSKVEITPEVLRKVADTCNIIKCNPRELSRDEVYEILMECM